MKNGNLDDICIARAEIIDGISDHIMLLDTKSYKILEVNRAFLKSYGLGRDEAVGRTCYAVTHHVDRPCPELDVRHRCPIVDSLSQDGPIRMDHIHYDTVDNDILVEIAAYPIKDETGEVTRIIHLSQDVTNRKRLEQAELKQEKLRAIIELAGATSHEINQPLTTLLIGLRQILKRSTFEAGEVELLRRALADAERLLETSRKLSTITRYETTQYIGERRIIDLKRSSAAPEGHAE